jgi:hypothetical protein
VSTLLTALDPNLKQLREEKYDIEIVGGHLAVHEIPYVNERREIGRGVLIMPLGNTAGDKLGPPPDHQAQWIGEHPCHADGRRMTEIVNAASQAKAADDLVASWNFSAKPKPLDNYLSFYDKVRTYVRRLSDPAVEIDPNTQVFTATLIRASRDDSVFKYEDTFSSRAEIVGVSNKLKGMRIAILGLGGTGSYILDFVATTHVKEIHLFDGDTLYQHNAFRAPGAVSAEDIQAEMKKVDYYAKLYGQMRHGLFPHPYFMDGDHLGELEGMTFVFISMEGGTAKRLIVEKLEALGIPFIDVGMGMSHRAETDTLAGTLRTTTSTPDKRGHIRERISFSDEKVKNEYAKNIQIGELNALNATLAVIKWKKLFGFYADLKQEHNCNYMIAANNLNNEEF